ncbi:hypothetical protein [Paludibaculum fermentans]|uniref:hypothetical protein n=1 Tax=Paludibaculum fermentans TaxID=1473598 RepID=UPI003EBDB02C
MAGILTISLDFELILGKLDKPGWQRFETVCETERRVVFDGLLSLFTEFDVSATWCTVGHLFLDQCRRQTSSPASSHHSHDGPCFPLDPCSNEQTAPLYYGKDLLDRLVACPTPQEIGCHTFSHVMYGDPKCTEAIAERETAKCVQLAEERGLKLRSFVFPRNRVGHLPVLARHGFAVYRGPSPRWFDQPETPRLLRKLGHLADIFSARTPPAVEATPSVDGLINLPASMLFTPAFGLRRFVPVWLRVLRARRGLREAVKQGKVFHLWFHPTDLAVRPEAMLAGLRQVLETADELRRAGELAILPMGAYAPLEAPALVQSSYLPARAVEAW